MHNRLQTFQWAAVSWAEMPKGQNGWIRQESYVNSNNYSSQPWWAEKHLKVYNTETLEVDGLQQHKIILGSTPAKSCSLKLQRAQTQRNRKVDDLKTQRYRQISNSSNNQMNLVQATMPQMTYFPHSDVLCEALDCICMTYALCYCHTIDQINNGTNEQVQVFLIKWPVNVSMYINEDWESIKGSVHSLGLIYHF